MTHFQAQTRKRACNVAEGLGSDKACTADEEITQACMLSVVKYKSTYYTLF